MLGWNHVRSNNWFIFLNELTHTANIYLGFLTKYPTLQPVDLQPIIILQDITGRHLGTVCSSPNISISMVWKGWEMRSLSDIPPKDSFLLVYIKD